MLKPTRAPAPPAKKEAAYVAPTLYASAAWLRVSRRPALASAQAATLPAPQNAAAPCAAASPGAWQLKVVGHGRQPEGDAAPGRPTVFHGHAVQAAAPPPLYVPAGHASAAAEERGQ